MYSMFLSSYRNTRESLGELKKAVETLFHAAHVPTAFLVLPNFHSCFYNSKEIRYIFSIEILNIALHKRNANKLMRFVTFRQNLIKYNNISETFVALSKWLLFESKQKLGLFFASFCFMSFVLALNKSHVLCSKIQQLVQTSSSPESYSIYKFSSS